jgi:hypothetical protein
MVAKITVGKSISGVINYNEKKVKEDKAVFFHSGNMPLDSDKLSYMDKVNTFEMLMEEQPNVKTNAVHIALAFDKSEHIDQATLREISEKYLGGIGFAEQPYLIYQHFDADHPHIHIVTTNLTEDRNRIDLHDIGRVKSEPIRKEIEKEFNLVVAEGRTTAAKQRERIPVGEYSKAGTKARISQIVRDISKTFAYASLAEYNTVLNKYGVMADQGTEGSKIRERKGLVYRLTNEQGEMYGHSIKASAIYDAPTLKNIEAKFEKNKVRKAQGKTGIKTVIDQVFKSYKHIDQKTFDRELASKNIEVVYRKNKEGLTYGLQFIDLTNKSVYKSSEIGKDYSPAQLLTRFSNYSLSNTQEKEISKALEAVYRQVKRSGPEYFFESTLIRALPKLKLDDQLMKLIPGLPVETARIIAGDFINKKNERLPQVVQQEQLAFKDRATGLLKFINIKTGLDLKTKLIFLLSNNIELKQVGNDVLLSDDRGKGVHVNIPGITIQELFKTKEKVNFVLTDKDKLPFTITERKIFTDIGKGNRIPDDYKYGSAYKVSFPRMDAFTDISTMAHIQQSLTRNYLHEVLPKISQVNAGAIMEELTSRGLLVKPNRAGELFIGYYRTANENYIKVPDQLSRVLLKGGYNSEVEKKLNELVYFQKGTSVSSRYDLIVKIKQYADQEKFAGIQTVLNNIKGKNPELHQILKSVADKMFVAKDKNDPEFALKNKFDKLVTQIIYNVLVNYPSKSLTPNTNINHQYIKNYIDVEANKLMKSIKRQSENKGKTI